jgi:hypothetical protein
LIFGDTYRELVCAGARYLETLRDRQRQRTAIGSTCEQKHAVPATFDRHGQAPYDPWPRTERGTDSFSHHTRKIDHHDRESL